VKRSGFFFWWLICVVVLFFVVNRIFFFSPSFFETFSSYLLHPVLTVQRTIVTTMADRLQRKKTIEALEKQLVYLNSCNQNLIEKNICLQASDKFAQETEELITFKKRYEGEQGFLVSVLLKHIADDQHYMLVDAGRDKGIVPDMVAVYKNCLIGKVIEVYETYSKILLITDRTCKVAAVCVGSNVHGIHEGTNSTNSSNLAHVSHLLQLQENDLVISSGEGLVFPKGFGLGTIDHFEPEGIHYHVILKPLCSIYCIEYCYLLAKTALDTVHCIND
jgi:rod shape-determining protein MreC